MASFLTGGIIATTDVTEAIVRHFQRFNELRSEFKRLAELYKQAEDSAERQDLLNQSHKILEEATKLNRAVQLEIDILHSRRSRTSERES